METYPAAHKEGYVCQKNWFVIRRVMMTSMRSLNMTPSSRRLKDVGQIAFVAVVCKHGVDSVRNQNVGEW